MLKMMLSITIFLTMALTNFLLAVTEKEIKKIIDKINSFENLWPLERPLKNCDAFFFRRT
jgi:hypothetical protein